MGPKGLPVTIYANKPDRRDEGLEAINQDLAKLQKKGKPSFQVFVGRGHSYHADEYLPLIEPSMNLVHLGSCGGYHNISRVLSESPEAVIISSKQRGSMVVNDPLLFNINESILQSGSVNWNEQQVKLAHFGSADKDSYLLPHKNVDLMMQKKYNELIKEPPHTSISREGEEQLPMMNTANVPLARKSQSMVI
jgi:hypothetical protein